MNQTLSARNYYLKMRGMPNWVWLIDKIFFWQPHHCRTSYLWWASGLEGQMTLREERNEKGCDKKEEHLKNIAKLL